MRGVQKMAGRLNQSRESLFLSEGYGILEASHGNEFS